MGPFRQAPATGLVVGIGSALVDILIYEEDAFLERVGAVKGGMCLVEKQHVEKALSLAARPPVIVPGGSACNTVVGIAKMGGRGRFLGKCGLDEMGRLFERDLKKHGVTPELFKSTLPTGRVLSIVTPDAQRSMLTFLGASSTMSPAEIHSRSLSGTSIVHVEGYLLFDQALMVAALAAAKNAGALVSLDLASFTVVEAHKEALTALVDEYVDIVIANEDEARIFTGSTREQDAIAALSRHADIAVLKVGEKGSYIAHADRIVKVDPVLTGPVVDTTGAGDLWAAGFLYGLLNGHCMETCGRLGSICGAAVCQITGTHIPEARWVQIRRQMEA